MIKSELRALRALPATKEMMQKGRRFREETVKPFYSKDSYIRITPEYDLLVRCQCLAPYKKVALFLPQDMRKGITTPRYEIFINEEGEEFITRVLDENGKEKKWSSSMVGNLDEVSLYSYYSQSNTKIFMSNDCMKTLNSLKLDSQGNYRGIFRLKQWQQEIRNREIKNKEDREQAPWDEDMALIPDTPKDFNEWMRKDVCKDVYIFYHYEPKGASEGYCSRCKKTIPIKKPKHGLKTRCPACKAQAIFKSDGKIQTLSTAFYQGELIQPIEGGIVVRNFRQHQVYENRHYSDPLIITHEQTRTLMWDAGYESYYRYESYKNKYIRWCKSDSDHTYGTTCTKLYKRNIKYLKKHTWLKNTTIDLWDMVPIRATQYLIKERQYPVIEMLVKIGMFKLAREIICDYYCYTDVEIDCSQTELPKILKLDKARLKRLKDIDGTIVAMKWLQLEKSMNTIFSDEMIKDYDIADIEFDNLRFADHVSINKRYNYLKKQSEIMKEDLTQTLSTWRDYIYMAKKMKMDIMQDQIVRPKDLKEAHDRLVLLSKKDGVTKQANELRAKWPRVEENLKRLEKFEYKDQNYQIIAPKSINDIVLEGVILSHCVHTCDYYFSRIQDNESYLFFLRKASSPDMPWYTLEVEPSGNIRQKRTTGDKQNEDFENAVKFLKKWQQVYKKQLTKEEKELGIKADQLRKENYKKLREDGNKVWHGPLAGKLLADVLEADFMEAI